MSKDRLSTNDELEAGLHAFRQAAFKQNAQIKTLREFGIKARGVFVSSLQIDAADIDKIIWALRQAKAVPR